MGTYRVTILPGDGIGREQTDAVINVLNAAQDRFGLRLEMAEAEAGDAAFKNRGVALPEDTVKAIKQSDACLKGPFGETVLETIVKLRQMLDLYANLRPAKAYPNVKCLRPDIDLIVVRENTEDLYKGMEFELDDAAVALRVITRKASQRIAEYAFKLAERRGRKVTAVHKSNVMKIPCGLFSKVCAEVAKSYPNISFNECITSLRTVAIRDTLPLWKITI